MLLFFVCMSNNNLQINIPLSWQSDIVVACPSSLSAAAPCQAWLVLGWATTGLSK